jgi:hypothetical protein
VAAIDCHEAALTCERSASRPNGYFGRRFGVRNGSCIADLIVDTWRSCHWATTPSRKGVGVSRELFGRQDVECVAAMVLEDWMPADQLITWEIQNATDDNT